jgi:hypothetical protein
VADPDWELTGASISSWGIAAALCALAASRRRRARLSQPPPLGARFAPPLQALSARCTGRLPCWFMPHRRAQEFEDTRLQVELGRAFLLPSGPVDAVRGRLIDGHRAN